MNNKEKLIEHFNKNGKDRSWDELAVLFDIKNSSGVTSGESARSIIRRVRAKNKAKSSLLPANATKLKRWQLPNGEWRESIQYDSKVSNVNEAVKELSEKLIDTLKEISPKMEYNHPKVTKGSVALEISLPDFHFGKLNGLTLEKQKEMFLEVIKEAYVENSTRNIERFILPIGNDFYNSEGYSGATTKGTRQHDNAAWQDTFTAGCSAAIEAINYLVSIAPVDVLIVPGNHDYERCFYLGSVIQAYFTNNKSVTVDNKADSRKYYVYGNTLIGFTHGDKEKHSDLPLIMATERPVDFSKCPNREWHIGHLHKHMVDEYRGIPVKVLPSLSGSDEWHKIMGYSAPRKCQVYIWNKKKGLTGYSQIDK